MMAEALGVVASGIAVAQAAGALGKLAMSMRTLWRDVGDVPTIIDHTLQQLEMTAKFIEEVEATDSHHFWLSQGRPESRHQVVQSSASGDGILRCRSFSRYYLQQKNEARGG
jgi:hypothetical protein